MRFLFGLFSARAQIEAAEKSRMLDIMATNRKLELELNAARMETLAAQADVRRATEAANFLRRERTRDSAVISDLQDELDNAWAACPYPGNRKHLSLSEQMAALDTELAGLRDKVVEVQRERDQAKLRAMTYQSGVELLASRASPEELAQLNLGTVILGENGKPDVFVIGDLEDAKGSVDFAMKNQATVAKFRQLKEHFQKHQQAVTIMLDQIAGITKKNRITAEDHERLRSMRDALSSLIGRSI